MMLPSRFVFLVFGLLVAASCRPPETAPDATGGGAETPESETPAAAVQIRLDSGNAAFREGDYENALRHYRAAAEAGPGNPSTWFGVYMAHRAMGNSEAADSALERTRQQVPGASLMRAPNDSVHR